MIYLTVIWERIPELEKKEIEEFDSKVSIIIPVRNEAKNLPILLEKLVSQDVGFQKMEIIFVNDHSTDASVAIINDWRARYSEISLIHMGEYTGSPKKNALSLAIARAKNEIILTTDGDCNPNVAWARSLMNAFQNKKVQLAIGPVGFFVKRLFDSVQWVEFSALVGITAVSASSGSPMMGNGANLAFRKSAFEKIGGYSQHMHIASGDDEFLVKSIFGEFGKDSITFIKAKSAIVKTNTCSNILELYYQRVRWASKWKLHNDFRSRVVPISIFAFYLLIIVAGVFSYLGYFAPWLFMSLMLVKFTANVLFVHRIGLFFSQKHSFGALLIAEVLYPFYAIIIGLSAIGGRFQWKQRRFR